MMHTPKTIITYLLEGNPAGIKTVELLGWVGKALIIPRSKLKEAKNRGELSQPALYFLFGKDIEDQSLAYIGEAENVYHRLANHDANKDFWELVIVVVDKGNGLTKADVKFLEAKSVEIASQYKRFKLLNSATPVPNNLPEYQESAMLDFLKNIELLVSSQGYHILKELPHKESSTVYYLKTKKANAKGIYSEEGFMILKGSIGSIEVTNSFGGKADNTRKELLQKGIVITKNNELYFTQDVMCSSPSHASSTILGMPSNGWIVWKDKGGCTLDENERKELKE